MEISVVIIAHNEEKYIEECILSLLTQSQKPDEIILVAHNCTDNTVKIAEKYPEVTIIKLDSKPLIISARIEGIQKSNGDIILCIDGDSYAENNWVECMTKTLSRNNNVLVGSWVKFKGTLFGEISNYFNKPFFNARGKNAIHFIWGPSLGFWSKDKDKVIEIFERSVGLSNELSLTRNPDDFWLALLMSMNGNIEVTNKTYTTLNQKEKSSIDALKRNFENVRNGKLIEEYINHQGIVK